MSTRIGWCSTANESPLAFPAPERFNPPKDASGQNGGFLNCPAVRGYFAGTFVVKSPFSLQLRYGETAGEPVIQPVFPFTSLSPDKAAEFVRVEPRASWRNPKAPILQLPSPYVFFADEPVFIRQEPPNLTTPASTSWRLIPGRFDIYAWQRPLNWAVEWTPAAGDLIIRMGEPLYFVRFESPSAGALEQIELIECPQTPEIQAQLASTRGITSLRRGTFSLFPQAAAKRAGKRLLPKEDA